MTKQEEAVLEALVDAWNKFVALPSEHPDDLTEFRQSMHALQNMVLSRYARREFNRNRVL